MTPRLRNLRTRVLAGAALFTATSGTVYTPDTLRPLTGAYCSHCGDSSKHCPGRGACPGGGHWGGCPRGFHPSASRFTSSALVVAGSVATVIFLGHIALSGGAA